MTACTRERGGRFPSGEGVERELEMLEPATVSLINERRRSRPRLEAAGAVPARRPTGPRVTVQLNPRRRTIRQ